jgi:hypothetical protein
MNESLLSASKWMELENIILIEYIQAQKAKDSHHLGSLITSLVPSQGKKPPSPSLVLR